MLIYDLTRAHCGAQGVWKPRKIPNPDYFLDEAPLGNIGQVGGVAIEIWTMDEGYLFDNILVANDASAAEAKRADYWAPKKEAEVCARACAFSCPLLCACLLPLAQVLMFQTLNSLPSAPKWALDAHGCWCMQHPALEILHQPSAQCAPSGAIRVAAGAGAPQGYGG